MQTVLVLGAGKIGALISGLLAHSGSYQVTLADKDVAAAAGVARAHGVATSSRCDSTPPTRRAERNSCAPSV